MIGEPAAASPRAWRVAEVAVVERVEPVGGEGLEGRRQRRQADALARPPRPAVRPVDRAERRRRGRCVDAIERRGPLDRRRRSASRPGSPSAASSMAGARIGPPRQPAEPRVGIAPGADRAGHRDRQRPAQRDRRVAGSRAGPPRQLPAGARPEPLSAHLATGRRVPDQPERVAADAAAVRHDHAEHGVRRDRRIDRGAARAQDRRGRPRSRGGAARRPRHGVPRASGTGAHGRPSVTSRPGRPGLRAPTGQIVCSCARSRDSGTIAMPSRISVAMNIPSMPSQSAATPPIRRR